MSDHSPLAPRDFKGIWIPREIWLHPELKPLEKILWAEIHSLFDREKGGCYASNEYLAAFLGIQIRHTQEMIKRLKDFGLIVQVSFDGRQRVIKAVLPPEDFGNASAQQTCTAVHGGHAPQCTPATNHSAPLSYIYSKEENKEYNTHKNASLECEKKHPPLILHGSHVKLKSDEYDELCKTHGKKVIDAIIDEMNDYCLASKPGGYKNYAAAIRQWIRNRNQQTQKCNTPFSQPIIDRRTRKIDGTPMDSPHDGRF